MSSEDFQNPYQEKLKQEVEQIEKNKGLNSHTHLPVLKSDKNLIKIHSDIREFAFRS